MATTDSNTNIKAQAADSPSKTFNELVNSDNLDPETKASLQAQAALQRESQAFQLAMAALQAQDAMSKSVISFQESMAASDRENANRVAQFAAK